MQRATNQQIPQSKFPKTPQKLKSETIKQQNYLSAAPECDCYPRPRSIRHFNSPKLFELIQKLNRQLNKIQNPQAEK